MPWIGSSSALPSWVAEPLRSWPKTVERSWARRMARVKVSPATERKVASTDAASCTASAVTSVVRSMSSAKAAICRPVSPAAKPVAFSTASSRR